MASCFRSLFCTPADGCPSGKKTKTTLKIEQAVFTSGALSGFLLVVLVVHY